MDLLPRDVTQMGRIKPTATEPPSRYELLTLEDTMVVGGARSSESES